MPSFLEEFLANIGDNVTPDPGTGFANFLDNIVPDDNNLPGQIIASPIIGPVKLLGAGLNSIAWVDSALSRPLSTAFQASTASNPLYRDGVQLSDFQQMWAASEYLSPGRAAMTKFFSPGTLEGNLIGAMAGNEGNWNELSFAPGSSYDPYALGAEGTEEAWDSSALGTIGSGVTDFAWQIAWGKGIGVGAAAAKRAAGLSTSVRGVRDLQALNNTLDQHLRYVDTAGAEGKWSPLGQGIEDIANTRNFADIYSSPWLGRWTTAGSKNRTQLAYVLEGIDDPRLVKDVLLADRGDYAAIGRLFQQAPDHVWTLTDMNSTLRAKFIEGGQYHFAPDEAAMVRQVFDSAVQRDEFYTAVRDMFMQSDADGLFSNVARGATFKPMDGVAGRAQKWLYDNEMILRTGQTDRWIARPLGTIGQSKPLTTLMQWVGGRKPLGHISLSGLRPDEAVDEIIYYANSSKALKGNPAVQVTSTLEDGTAVTTSMTMAEWRVAAIGRLGQAKVRGGDGGVYAEIEKLEQELVSAVANKYGFDAETTQNIIRGLQDAKSQSVSEVVRDGFWWDDELGLARATPTTRRQFAQNYQLLPLDEIDRAFRQEAASLSKSHLMTAQEKTAHAFDFVLRIWRTNMLFKPGYTPKNAVFEPALASLLSHGTIVSPSGAMWAFNNFMVNRARQIRSMGYKVADVTGISGLRRASKNLTDLHRERQLVLKQLDDQEAFIQAMQAGELPPSVARRWATIAVDERRDLDRALATIEARLDEVDPIWTQVREVPGLRQLSQRLDDIEAKEVLPRGNEHILNSLGRGTVDANFIPTMRARFDDMRVKYPELFEARPGSERWERPDLSVGNGGDWYVPPAKMDEYLQRYFEDYIPDLKPDTEIVLFKGITEDSGLSLGVKRDADGNIDLFGDAGATRVVPSGGSWWTFDPEVAKRFAGGYQSSGTGKVAEIRMTWQEYVDYRASLPAKKTFAPDPFDHMSGVAEGGWIEWAVKLDYTKIPAAWKNRVKIVDADSAASARSVIDTAPLREQLTEIRRQVEDIAPSQERYANLLADQLAEIEMEIGITNAKVAGKRAKRETARQRDLGGDEDLVVVIDGEEIRIPGLYNEGQFGTAIRAEASSSRTNSLTFDPNQWGQVGAGRWMRRGQVERVDPLSPDYWPELAYIANRQVRGDALAVRILQGDSLADILKWLRTPAGRKYAKGMGWDRGSSNRMWVAEDEVVDRINRINEYFPTEQSRARLLAEEDVTPAEMQRLLGDVEDLRPVHAGELTYNKRGRHPINNALNAIFNNLAVKPEDRFGRFPWLDRQWRMNVREDAQFLAQQGQEITPEVLNNLRAAAAARALKDLDNTFYNINRYSNPVFALRYLTGFPGAYYNSLYRYAKLSYQNPGRSFVMANAYMGTYESFGVDLEGNPTDDWSKTEYLAFPVPSEIADMLQIDDKVKISTRTVDFVTQAPTFLPHVMVPVSTLLKHKPTANEWMKDTLDRDTYRMFFPFDQPTVDNQIVVAGTVLDPMMSGWQMDLMTALTPGDEDFIQASSLIFQYSLAEWEQGGKVGKPPTPEQAAVDARNFFFGKSFAKFLGLSGFNSQPVGAALRDEWYTIREMFPGDVAAAREEFVRLHGEGMRYITYSTSDYRVYMPSTAEAYNRLQDNSDLANRLRQVSPESPEMVSIMFWGSQGDFDPTIYNWMADNSIPGDVDPMRSKLSPEQIADKTAVSESWKKYNAAIAKRDGLMVQYGYKQLSPDNDSAWLYDQWQTWLNNFQMDDANAQWLEDYGNFSSNRSQLALRGLTTVLADQQFMSENRGNPGYVIAARYLENRQKADAAYMAADSEQRKVLQEEWNQWVTANLLPGSTDFSGFYVRYLQGKDLGL